MLPLQYCYRFSFLTLRGSNADGVQLAELQMRSTSGLVLNVTSVSNPGGEQRLLSQHAGALVDGSLSSKWFDESIAVNKISTVILAVRGQAASCAPRLLHA